MKLRMSALIMLSTLFSIFASAEVPVAIAPLDNGFFGAPVVYSKTALTMAPVGSIVYDPSVGVFYGLTGNGAPSSAANWVAFNSSTLAGIGSTATATGGNGHGSTGNKIRRFTSGTSSSAITYTADSTNGDTFTVNTAGVYSIVYHDNHNVATTVYTGISKNAASSTTSVISISASELLDLNASFGGSSYATSTWTGYLNAGDIIRAHTDGVPTATLAYLVRLSITKITN